MSFLTCLLNWTGCACTPQAQAFTTVYLAASYKYKPKYDPIRGNMIITNHRGDEKCEILSGEPGVNNIVFKGGQKHNRREGNKELEGEINQNLNNYSTANHKTKKLTIAKIYTKLNGLQKGSKSFECSAGNFNGRYIECRSGKLYLLQDKKHVYSCLRHIFTWLKSPQKKSPADNEKT